MPVAELDALGLSNLHLVVVHTVYNLDTHEYEEKTVTYEQTEGTFNGKYRFSYPGIAPMELNDHMEGYLVGEKDGVTWISNRKISCPVDYYYAVAQAGSGPSAELKTACANLIKFAAAAQTVFGYNTANMADADWNATLESVATSTDPVLADNRVNVDLEGKTTRIRSMTLNMEARVEVNFLIEPPKDEGGNYLMDGLVLKIT